MTWFLKAKHWQIFLLIFVAPFVIELFGFLAIIWTNMFEVFFGVFLLAMVIVLSVQFGWFYSVGTALANRIGPNSGMNLKRFKSFVLIPLIYIGCFLFGMIIIGLIMMNNGRPSPYLAFLFFIIVPLHLFSMFCIFHTIWFIAKSLKMNEKWNHVDFSDYVGEFFLTWFLFVGIWFLQPRINRLFDPTLPPEPPKPTYQNPNYNWQNYPPQNPSGYPPNYPPQNPQGYPPTNQ